MICATMCASERSSGSPASLQVGNHPCEVCAVQHNHSTRPTVPRVAHSVVMWNTRMWGGLIGVFFLGLCAEGVLGQRATWRIPLGGAVEYARQGATSASEVYSRRQAAKRAPLSSALPSRYLHRLPPAPFLCQGELRDDQRALAQIPGMVADLRDLLRALAMDVSGRSASARFPRLLPFGDIAIAGRWSPRSGAASQQLQATFTSRSPAR